LLLDDNLSAEQLQGIVMLKRAELEQRVQSEQMRLARVEARLKQIEQEGKLPVYEVILRSIPDQMAACARTVVPTLAQLDEQRGKLRRMVSAWLDTARYESKRSLAGAVRAPGVYRTGYRTIGSGAAWKGRFAPANRAGASEPAASSGEPWRAWCTAAARGELYPALHAFYSWADSNGYRVCGPAREIYLEEEGSESARVSYGGAPVPGGAHSYAAASVFRSSNYGAKNGTENY
jgi:hypothetical protein